MNKAVFLDRDGVINEENGYVFRIEDFKFIPGVFEALKFFLKMEYLLFIVTNQAGIAHGYYTEGDYHTLNNWMISQLIEQGIRIKKVYYCPYHPKGIVGKFKRDSGDRKPNPGMLLKAQKEYNINLKKSILIGDQFSDIEAGEKAGVGTNLLINTGQTIANTSHFVRMFDNLFEVIKYFEN